CFDAEEALDVDGQPTCEGVDEDITEDDLKGVYDDCTACNGCWELTNCHDDEDIIYIKNDLIEFLGVATAEDITEADPPFVLEFAGACYQVTDLQSPCEEEGVLSICDGALGFG